MNGRLDVVMNLQRQFLSTKLISWPGNPKKNSSSCPMLISKITCGAFVLSTEGRLRLMKRAVDAADILQKKDVVDKLNKELLWFLLAAAVEETG